MHRDCEKIAYRTYAEAEKALGVIRGKQKTIYRNGHRVNSSRRQSPKRAYRCDRCGMYHLTSKK